MIQDSVDDSVAAFIDLERYPMADLSADEGKTFVMSCITAIRETGVCNLSGFVKPEAAAEMAAQGLALIPRAYRDDSRHNVCFTAADPTLPKDHPSYLSQRIASNTIPYDLIPSEALLRRLYNWTPLRDFVAAVLEKDELHLHADPMGAMIMFIYDQRDELGWHFDHACFATTIVLQRAEGGGDFEYVQGLRSPENENYAGIRRIVAGAKEDVIRLPGEAGTLNLFAGQHSLHRVAPIEGFRPRAIAVLSDEEEPNVRFTDEQRIRFYGRSG